MKKCQTMSQKYKKSQNFKGNEMKICKQCKESKPITAFCYSGKNGRRNIRCKECENDIQRARYHDRISNKFEQLSIKKWGLA